MPTYFLTGATGLIGSHVAERLRRRGDGVVALVRPTSDTAHLESLGCELVTGDVLDPPREQAARMRGAAAVIHAAAMVFVAGGRKEYLRVNVEGTGRVLEAASLAAPRIIHLSSVAVYSGLRMDRPLAEDRWREADPRRQARYPASKHLSERAAWAAHERGAVRLTTLRPSVVYGERDRAATPLIVRFARLPVVPLIGGGRTRLPLVYAANVARGIVAALDREETIGRAYNLGLDEPITAEEMVYLIAEADGRRARVVRVPALPLLAAATGVEWLTRLTPMMRRSDFRRVVRSIRRDNPYDSTRARLELGWTHLVTHREGIRRTMAWWRKREAE